MSIDKTETFVFSGVLLMAVAVSSATTSTLAVDADEIPQYIKRGTHLAYF